MNNNGIRKRKYYQWLIITTLISFNHRLMASNDLVVKNEYNFNSDFFVGDNNVDLSRFKFKNSIAPGDYSMMINLNGRHVGRATVKITDLAETSESIICANSEIMGLINLKEPKLLLYEEGCVPLQQAIPDINYIIDLTSFTINLTIPQIYLSRKARGDIDEKLWESGINAGFINYNANYYENNLDTISGKNKYTSFFTLFNSGINIGLWQFRNNSNYNDSQGGTGKWRTINSYVQRPIAYLKSNLIIGEYSSSGQYLDSINFKGIQLSSDDRMLPDSLQGFAPVVRGVAQSNATVEVSQRGTLLYKTSVPQGPFMIDDLYPTGYGGELDVVITEADGTIQRYSVPFSSVAQLLREGLSQYSVIAGKLNTDNLRFKPEFIQAWYSRGISNRLTGYLGGQLSEHYQSVVTGAALNTSLGAFGIDVTNSFAEINDGQERKKGWSIKASHSKLVEYTDTYLSLSTYRYSSEDYYNFNDAAQAYDNSSYNPWNQKSRFEISINQPISDDGSLFLSGSKSTYWNRGETTTSYQGGYSFIYKGINFGITLSRVENSKNKNENRYSLSMSIPFTTENHTYYNISSSFSSSNNGSSQAIMGVNGVTGNDNDLSYGISMAKDSQTKNSVSGNLTKNYSQGKANLSASKGKNYDQYSIGLSGSVVAHSGGVTLGQYTSGSMALIEADNAGGARVENTPGVTIDRLGYAIVPYINPYRVNDIAINPEGISDKTELKGTSQQIVPYNGAIVKVKFKTVTGYKAFIYSTKPDGDDLPMGASVINEKGHDIGMVGQGGVIYASGLNEQGILTIIWSKSTDGRCSIPYDIQSPGSLENHNGILNLSLSCIME